MLSGVAVALPLTARSSQFVIGSFEARFFCAERLDAARPRIVGHGRLHDKTSRRDSGIQGGLLECRWKTGSTSVAWEEGRLRPFCTYRPGIDAGFIGIPIVLGGAGPRRRRGPHRRERRNAQRTRHECRAYDRLRRGTTVNGRWSPSRFAFVYAPVEISIHL